MLNLQQVLKKPTNNVDATVGALNWNRQEVIFLKFPSKHLQAERKKKSIYCNSLIVFHIYLGCSAIEIAKKCFKQTENTCLYMFAPGKHFQQTYRVNISFDQVIFLRFQD